MNQVWIEDWRKEIGQDYINLKGITNTTKNLDIAMDYSKCHTDFWNHTTPVVFVISIWNNSGFKGFRLTDKRFSVYPEEQEVLLMEGFPVYVLDIQDGFEIENKNEQLKKYDGKKITIIYLQSRD